MTRRLPLIAGWLIAGHAAAAGLFWALLQVPESSSLMLAISATLALLAVLAVALDRRRSAGRVASGSDAGSRHGTRARATLPLSSSGCSSSRSCGGSPRRAPSGTPSTGGQLDAWIIARTGKSETARLHGAIFWLLWFLRWGLGLTIALVAGRVGGARRSARARERPMAGERAQPAPLARRHGAGRPRHRAAVASRLLAAGEDLDWGGAVVRDGEAGADRPGRDVRVGVDLARRHAAAERR